jgi:hypothetical protein
MRPVRPGRPLGEVSKALLSAAQHGSGTVRQLAARACVGFDVARYKAKDLVRMGALQPLTAERPRMLGLPEAVPPHENPFALLERGLFAPPAAAEAAED